MAGKLHPRPEPAEPALCSSAKPGLLAQAWPCTPPGDHGADAGAGCFDLLGSREKLSEDEEGGKEGARKQ